MDLTLDSSKHFLDPENIRNTRIDQWEDEKKDDDNTHKQQSIKMLKDILEETLGVDAYYVTLSNFLYQQNREKQTKNAIDI